LTTLEQQIKAVYRSNPNASRRQVLDALGIQSNIIFDRHLVFIQNQLRGNRPEQKFTKNDLVRDHYGNHIVGWDYE
jgi:hypothetical protein